MKTIYIILAVVVALAVAFLAIFLWNSGKFNGNGSGVSVGNQTSRTPVSLLQVDCIANSSGCSTISIQGDGPSSGKFQGYADPTIRQDPQTGYLWMAYSWTHQIKSSGGKGMYNVVDTHLAESTDGGKTWQYKGALYTSRSVLNPVTGNTDYTSNEVMNLYPEVVHGVTYWYGIHSLYQVGMGANGTLGQEDDTKRWEISYAAGTPDGGPMALSSAAPEYLGGFHGAFFTHFEMVPCGYPMWRATFACDHPERTNRTASILTRGICGFVL